MYFKIVLTVQTCVGQTEPTPGVPQMRQHRLSFTHLAYMYMSLPNDTYTWSGLQDN